MLQFSVNSAQNRKRSKGLDSKFKIISLNLAVTKGNFKMLYSYFGSVKLCKMGWFAFARRNRYFADEIDAATHFCITSKLYYQKSLDTPFQSAMPRHCLEYVKQKLHE